MAACSALVGIHRRRHAAALLWVTACLFLAAAPRAVWADAARVQYLSTTNVYLDAGSAEGLVDGATVTVKHGGKEVARLTVVYVAQHSASCRIESSTEPVRVGDVCSFSKTALSDSAGFPGAAPSPSVSANPERERAAGAGAEDRAWSPPRHVGGHIMTLYTRTSAEGGSYENPSVLGDLRWSGRREEQVSLRIYAAQPSSHAVTDLPGLAFNESQSRVYEAAAQYRDPSGRLEAAAGRYLAPRLEALGYLDGAGALWRARPGVAIGFAGGKGSDLGVAGFNSQGARAGGWIEFGSSPRATILRWRALLSGGYMGDSAITRRQYVAQRLDLWPGRNSVMYQSVEVDFNPGWKRALGEDAMTLTAWSVGGSFRFQPRLWSTLAFDSRRPLVLPEQRFIPTLPSPDRYTGLHASSRYDLSVDQSVWVGGAVRRRDRDGKMYESWDVGLNSRRLIAQDLSGGVHAYGYNDGPAQGINSDADLTARLRSWSTLEVSGGYGATLGDAGAAGVPQYRSRWVRAGLDLRGPQGSWLRIAHEWQGGGPGNELTAELGFAF